MTDLIAIASKLAWPLAIILAWVVGEIGHRWTSLPRISFYGLVGLSLGLSESGFLPSPYSAPMLADVAFALILFEMGYRINLRWLVHNPWIGVAGVAEAFATFAAVYGVTSLAGIPVLPALTVAALSMATSPATVVRVINELRSAGQVTERVLHMTALNCMLAVFTFNIIIGFWIFQSTGDIGDATVNSLVSLLLSAGAGVVFGVLAPALLQRVGQDTQDATVGFALAVILLVALSVATRLSPVVAALAFGLTARHHRVAFGQAERSFGALGELLTMMLFVFAASTLTWHRIDQHLGLVLAIVAVRLGTKTICVAVFSHVSGVSWRKGLLAGLALQLMAAVMIVLEIIGPVILQRALIWARETPQPAEVRHAA